MNEKDICLVEHIMAKIREHRNSSLLVFNTTFTQIGKTNLLLLKGLLDIDGESGFFVVLDRPHQYMSYLLHMHMVNQENIWYIDGVTHTSGTKKEESDHVNFLEGPFHIDNLFDKIGLDSMFAQKGFPPSETIDFFLIDNIATMLNYNDIDVVERFVLSFHGFIKTNPHMMGAITIDKESNPELSDILIRNSDHLIDIEELKKEVMK